MPSITISETKLQVIDPEQPTLTTILKSGRAAIYKY